MSDIIDDAVKLQEMFNDNALKNRVRTVMPSALYCEDCGEEICEERRKAIVGVQRCVSCQTIYERKKH